MTPQARTRSVPLWLDPVAIGALSLALGGATLGRKSFWFDEAFNAQLMAMPWRATGDAIFSREMSQSAYLVILRTWASMVLLSDVTLRLPSLLFAALASAMLVVLARRLFDRPTASVAGVLLATNAMLVSWSQQARTYTLVTLAVVITTLAFLRALDDSRRRNWLIYAIAAATSVYCHFYGGLVVAAHLASLLVVRSRPRWRHVAESCGLIALLGAPALYFTATAPRDQVAWIRPPSAETLVVVADATTGMNRAFMLLAVGGLLVLASHARAGDQPRRRAALIAGWVLMPPALAWSVSSVHPILVPRYAIVMTPGLALAAAAMIAEIAARSRLAAAIALTVTVAVSTRRIEEWYVERSEDWRAAAAFVARRHEQGDAVVVRPEWAALAYEHYAPLAPLPSKTPRRLFVVMRGNPAFALSKGPQPGDYLAKPILSGIHRFGTRLVVRVYTTAP